MDGIQVDMIEHGEFGHAGVCSSARVAFDVRRLQRLPVFQWSLSTELNRRGTWRLWLLNLWRCCWRLLGNGLFRLLNGLRHFSKHRCGGMIA